MKIKLIENAVVGGAVWASGIELEVTPQEARRLLNQRKAVAVKATAKKTAIVPDETEKAVTE